MKPLAASIITPLLVFAVAPAFAIESPRIVPRMNEVQKPEAEVFATLKKYFTDSSLSNFQLVSADERTHTLVAKQALTDDLSWRKWAFCKTGPVQMVYKFEDGTVTVTVKLEKTSRQFDVCLGVGGFPGPLRTRWQSEPGSLHLEIRS